MPALSPTMKDGIVVKWLKQEGDTVALGDVIAEIETDKAVMELEAQQTGILGKILVQAQSCPTKVNDTIAILLETGEGATELESACKGVVTIKPDDRDCSTSSVHIDDGSAYDKDKRASEHGEGVCGCIDSNYGSNVPDGANKTKASPLAKRLASANHINLSMLKGSGPHGRIIRADVETYVSSDEQNSNCHKISTHCSSIVRRDDTQRPLSRMRQVIGHRLMCAKQTIPHFYLDAVFDVDRLLALKDEINSALAVESTHRKCTPTASISDAASDTSSQCVPYGVKISVNDILIRAAALALYDVPEMNVMLIGEVVTQLGNADVCVAVALEDGLITPVIRSADQKSVTQISSEIRKLAAKAKSGKLHPEEYSGGSITVSNLGMHGVREFHAIINPPQAAIIAVGAIYSEAVITNECVKAKNRIHISLSLDHRIIDGVLGARYMQVLRTYIDNPMLLLL